MEKNGNTLEPGDKVKVSSQAQKVASADARGRVLAVDTETEQVHVDFGSYTRWIGVNELERQ